MGHFLGADKIFFLIRDIEDPAMTAASVESCRFVVPRSLGGRLGSVRDMGNRLRRMRGRFQRWIHLPRCISSQMSPAQNANPWIGLSGSPAEQLLDAKTS